jgi:predicted ArsR family transcriptional regulator
MQPLQPTLWRTCRVLANSTRLKLFTLLVQHRSLTVSGVATQLRLSVAVTSEYLRALEARGFLVSRRDARWVEYSISSGQERLSSLITALRLACNRNDFVDSTFRLATAFTHPRRIDVFRAVTRQPRRFAELRSVTGIPARALLRHLQKLKARGFIVYRRGRPGTYVLKKHGSAVGRALAGLALHNV